MLLTDLRVHLPEVVRDTVYVEFPRTEGHMLTRLFNLYMCCKISLKVGHVTYHLTLVTSKG